MNQRTLFPDALYLRIESGCLRDSPWKSTRFPLLSESLTSPCLCLRFWRFGLSFGTPNCPNTRKLEIRDSASVWLVMAIRYVARNLYGRPVSDTGGGVQVPAWEGGQHTVGRIDTVHFQEAAARIIKIHAHHCHALQPKPAQLRAQPQLFVLVDPPTPTLPKRP